MRFSLDGWVDTKTPEAAEAEMILPFKAVNGKWSLGLENSEFDTRLDYVIDQCRGHGVLPVLDLCLNQYQNPATASSSWKDYMAWTRNIEGVDGIFDPKGEGYRRKWINRVVDIVDDRRVIYSAGNELEGPVDVLTRFNVDVIGQLYKLGVPISDTMLGVCFSSTFVKPYDSSLPMERVKTDFDAEFVRLYPETARQTADGPTTAFDIMRYFHGVQESFWDQRGQIFLDYHAAYGVKWFISTDGGNQGSHMYDYMVHRDGRISRKPSKQEIKNLFFDICEAHKGNHVIWFFELFHEGQFLSDGIPDIEMLKNPERLIPILDGITGLIEVCQEFWPEEEVPNLGKFPPENQPEPEPEPPDPDPESAKPCKLSAWAWISFKNKKYPWGFPNWWAAITGKGPRWCKEHHCPEDKCPK